MTEFIIKITMVVAGAILYRLGGMGGAWYGNTKVRDVGVPLIAWAWMFLYVTTYPWWVHIIAALLLFGSLTTYWDSIFGYDNFWVHGFMIGFAFFPYNGGWVILASRCMILCFAMGFINWYVNKIGLPKGWRGDWVEELSRGGFTIATLQLYV